MLSTLLYFHNIDLFVVGITVAGIAVLGFTAYFSNTKNATNVSFWLFTLSAALWSIVNYLFYHIANPYLAFWIIRTVIFLATWFVFFLFQFLLVFPAEKYIFPKKYLYGLLPLTCFISLMTLTPLVFNSIGSLSNTGAIETINNGPGIFFFALFVTFLIFGGLWIFIKKMRLAPKSEKGQYRSILWGLFVTFLLIISFNLVLPAFYNNASFISLGALFILPTVVAAGYEIAKYHLFRVKVFATSLLIFLLSISILLEVLSSATLFQIIFRSMEFVLVLAIGILLIRSVLREVEQREHIQELANQLEFANNQQVALIHFITHQVKGFLTKSRNVFSMALEGEFGPIPDTFKPILQMGLESDTKGVNTVQEILNASNIKSGKITYSMQLFDLAALLSEIITTLKPNADAKKLSLKVTLSENPCEIQGDRMQLENAFKNIIDNAIKYTPAGEVAISLTKEGSLVRIIEQDTGVGITPEDMGKLFTEGGHGKESVKVNVDSTGFGLYIVKNIITAHNGEIWAESEGAGKGSKFTIELPIMQPNTPTAVSA